MRQTRHRSVSVDRRYIREGEFSPVTSQPKLVCVFTFRDELRRPC